MRGGSLFTFSCAFPSTNFDLSSGIQKTTLQILLFKINKNETQKGAEKAQGSSQFDLWIILWIPHLKSQSVIHPHFLWLEASVTSLTCLVIGFNNPHSVAMGQNSNAGVIKNFFSIMQNK